MFLKKITEELSMALADAGFEMPRTLQKKCISQIKSGADIVCLAPTNAGKTSTILIGVTQQLKKAVDDVPRALIIGTDNGAAEAMKEQFDIIAKNTDLRVMPVYERSNIQKEKDKVYLGSDVVIGTAKRIGELYSNNALNLTGLKMFITDDAELVIRNTQIAQMHRFGDSLEKTQQIMLAGKMTEAMERYIDKFVNVHSIMKFDEE